MRGTTAMNYSGVLTGRKWETADWGGRRHFCSVPGFRRRHTALDGNTKCAADEEPVTYTVMLGSTSSTGLPQDVFITAKRGGWECRWKGRPNSLEFFGGPCLTP